MIHLSSQQLLQIFPQENSWPQFFDITSVVIDSRKSVKDSLFVAIRGENFDGHQFINKAAEQGAVAAIVDHIQDDLTIPQVLVKDTRQALADLANFWRNKLNPLVVAITGSNGKTTVKEMLGYILKGQGQTLMTSGNFNNEIGVPLTLFQLSEGDQYAVIEMGANHMQEISRLVQIAEPDIVYVNNAMPAHLEGFGSLKAVVEAKGEIYRFCKKTALAVFNDDEASVNYWKSISLAHKELTFSSRQKSDVTGKGTQLSEGLQLQVSYQEQQFDSQLKVYGEHNVQNALAAVTLAIACGLTAEQACHNLNNFSGVKGRQQFITGVNGSVIIDDSYNANPGSLSAAIRVLCSLDGTPWIALGDMAEMGDESLRLHQQAAVEAKNEGVKQFFALGELSCQAATVFAENGFCFDKHDEMAEFLASRLDKNINLLVKGSRSAAMEKVVKSLSLITGSSESEGVIHAV